ncbi:hypothetical protein PsorP6_000681 [Peronosclerospora sorghi]|uniref:Uncharacterized protein n=1 Tax=Peronosclerospora sorghi TaxID=230839 RepID=A0ACC0WV01_9STRA|nr:hypothetical protein PsorP6_000681 [Peronosclerospora sorghi]
MGKLINGEDMKETSTLKHRVDSIDEQHDGSRKARRNPLATSMTPPASVRASMDFTGPLNALSTSRTNRLIAVGGRDGPSVSSFSCLLFESKSLSSSSSRSFATVLKVVALEASGFTEKRNLRVVGRPSLNFSTNDIRWHPHLDSVLATAATNGAVVIWNLERDGYKHVQERVLHGHRRAVNRICWHTSDWNVLISGSQDGTVKLWDKRAGKVVATYHPKSESVRDVRTSPFHATHFAAAFENGIVQVWDLRKHAQPLVKFTAHKGLVLSLDWHPTQANVLASGGRDRYVKIWTLSDVRQPRQTIQTIASVGRVAWRPSVLTHVATSASLMDNSIHVWETTRPFIPLASMKGHVDIASGIAWLDTPVRTSTHGASSSDVPGDADGHQYWQHVLACSKDGTLKLHALADAFKPHASLRTTALALNSSGHVAFSHDYIDRSCASLQLHRHVPATTSSTLFTVAHVSSASPSSKAGTTGTPKSPRAYPASLDDATASFFGTGPSLPPKPLPRSSSSSTSLVGLAPTAGAASGSSTGAFLGPTSPVRDGHFVAVSRASTLASPHRRPPVPRALVNLVTLQSVLGAHDLAQIFHGDERAYVYAEHHVAALRTHFPNGQYLSESFGFDEQAFRFLAKHYRLFPPRGDRVRPSLDDPRPAYEDMYATNALAAFVAGQTQVAQMWRILQVLYTPQDVERADKRPNEGIKREHEDTRVEPAGSCTQTPRTYKHNASETTMLLEQLDHVNPQAMEAFASYPCHPVEPRDGTEAASGVASVPGPSSLIQNGSAVRGDLGHVRRQVLKEVLEYATALGDVQTSVAISVVVGTVTNVEQVMGKAWMQQIAMHYIDLLHQLQLYTSANELVVHCTDPSIRQMNMKSTSVSFNCARCAHPLEAGCRQKEGPASVRLCANCNHAATLFNYPSAVSTSGVLCVHMAVTWTISRNGLHARHCVRLDVPITARSRRSPSKEKIPWCLKVRPLVFFAVLSHRLVPPKPCLSLSCRPDPTDPSESNVRCPLLFGTHSMLKQQLSCKN